MREQSLDNLPGAEIVLPGLDDARAGRRTVNAAAAQAAAPRLRRLGLEPPADEDEVPAAHRLYRMLSEELGDAAHARYNAVLARLDSFATAAERAQRS